MALKLNLQKKILLGLGLILTVLVIILSSAFYNYLFSETINKEFKTSQRITERTSLQIDELFKQMDMGALFIVKNEVIQNVLSSLHNNKNISDYQMINFKGQARDQLKILSYYFPNMTNAVIFDSKVGFYFHSGLPDEDTVVKKRLADLDWYNSLFVPEKQLQLLPPHQDYWAGITRPVISVVRRLETSSKQDLGLLEIDLPYWSLQNICNTNTVSEDSMILIFDNKGNLVHPFDYESVDSKLFKLINNAKIYDKIKDPSDSSGEFTITGSKILYTSHKSKFTQLNTVLVTKETALQKQMFTYIFFIIIAGIIILISVFFAFFILIGSLTKPLKRLTSTIENVSLDNMNLEIPHGSQDELKMLNESFNAMFSKLKDSINLVYESKIRETNANLLALQAQINPHFLYNTLGIISASSEKHGNLETASMCNKLSDMMRYIVSPVNDRVTLKEEISHTLHYLNLMEHHYRDYRNNYESMLKFKIEIPEEMNMIILPKMTLQPIVENCINHGFEKTLPPWYINITGQILNNGNWFISIEDSGSGFDAETLDKINTQINEYSMNLREGNFKQNLRIGGMGILNTYARLAINFKEDVIFRIENKHPNGSILTFGGSMPLKEEH
jgi:two-component system, sensor histidine kinase YesM